MEFEQLGPYRLDKVLGKGGMGTVYRGVDVTSSEPAAVKVLLPHLAVEGGFRARFEAEIESLKKLRHPNIVRLLGYGEQDGALFYAMELVVGSSMEDELHNGRHYQWRETTELAIQLCRALKHAHDHGIIHRDIKPANLLLPDDGVVKLSDFGIARLFGNSRVTSDGGILGTAEYMAPEQAEGRGVTDRCDQYSLGGVLYTMLAGRPPFRANSFVEMLQLQRFAEPEPLRRYAPDSPAELQRIIHQLLEKDPQKRFTNALMLGRSLEAMLRGLSLAVETPPEEPPATPIDQAMTVQTAGTSLQPLPPTVVPPSSTNADAAATEYEIEPLHAAATALNPTLNTSAPDKTAEPPQPALAKRFTKVTDHDDEGPSWWSEARDVVLTPQTLGLAAMLLLMLAAGWYALLPINADQLYARIETTTAPATYESLRAAAADMQSFIERFPEDSRAGEVQQRIAELETQQRDRQIKLRARGFSKSAASTPVEIAYTDALSSAGTNPERAIVRLQALVDVFDDPAASEATRNTVALARNELSSLRQQVSRAAIDQLKQLEARLTAAEGMPTSETGRARRICEGVIELYADKPWAASAVTRARHTLAKLPATAANLPSSSGASGTD